jgi:hypothetical protein
MDPSGFPQPNGPPAWMARTMRAPDSASVIWRCAGGKVLACVEYSTSSCVKPSTATRPDEIMREYCRENPNADLIPASHMLLSVFFWRCTGARPVIARRSAIQPADLDARGFLASEWRAVAPPAARKRKAR